MSSTLVESTPPRRYELRFTSLYREGCALAFPCDRTGHVDFEDLNDRARNNYFYARATVGRDFGLPRVDVASGGTGIEPARETWN